MELYKEILSNLLANHELEITFKNLPNTNPAALVESACYQALRKIQGILDSGLDDFDCVEHIVHVFEDMGSTGGTRHDFG